MLQNPKRNTSASSTSSTSSSSTSSSRQAAHKHASCTWQAAHKHTNIQAAGGYGGPRRGPGEVQARSKAVHPSPSTMPSPEAPKLQSAHGHMPKIQSAHSSTLQRHQHPSSQAHTAAALCNAPAPKLPSTPCGGTSAQARARKHAALPTLEQQRHPSAAPAPTLENAHTQLLEVRTLIAHAVC